MRLGNRLAYSLVLVAAALLSTTSLAAPDLAACQGTGQIPFVPSAYLQHAVTLDARLTTPDEWAESTPVDLTLSRWFQGEASTTGRWWVKNEDQWLYLLARIEWPANDTDGDDGGQIGYFWPAGSCCPWDHSDLGYVGFDGEEADLYGWDDTRWYDDVSAGGTNDVEGGGRHDGTYYWFEFRKRLDSGDDFDWEWQAGDWVGTGSDGSLLLSFWDNSEPASWETHVTIQLATSQRLRVFLPVVLKTAPQVQPSPTVTPLPAPDIVYHNGHLLTLEGQTWDAEAIALRGPLIQAVGTDTEVLRLRGPSTQVVDLQGLCLMPGFVDPHSHLFNDSYRMGLDWEQSQQQALRNGITTAANMYCDADFVRDMRQFDRDGKLIIRTSMYLLATDVAGNLQGDWWKAYPPTRAWGERLRVAGLKAFSDGGAEGCPAYSFEDPRCGFGDLWLTQQQMDTLVRDAQTAGYQLAVHSLGDRSLEQVMDAYETVLQGQPNTLRHRIEHNSVVRDEQLTRYTDIGIVAAVFGGFPCGSWTLPPAQTLPWKWRWSDLLVANPTVHFAWHSDTPWVGPPNDPLSHLYSLVTDKEIDSQGTECDTPSWLSQKTVTVQQALPMMTIEAAYALFRETEVGSLKPGKLADLIILSDSPTRVQPAGIKGLQVLVTVVGGVVEHCASGYERLCR